MNENLSEDARPPAPAPAVKPDPDIHKTAERLAEAVAEGSRSVPPTADERPLLVCKPARIESWRVFKIMAEFVEGFDVIRRYGLAATFFGYARLS